MYQAIAVAIMFVATGSSTNGHPTKSRDQGIDSVFTMQRECLCTLEQVLAELALVSQHIDSIRFSSAGEKTVDVVVQEHKSLRKGIAAGSEQLIEIPARAFVTLVDYQSEPVPSFQVTYGVDVGWLTLNESEINSEVSHFVARRTVERTSGESDTGFGGIASQFVVIIFTALMTFLATVGTLHLKGRRNRKQENIQREKNVWHGLEKLREDMRKKYEDPTKREQAQPIEYLNVDTYAYICSIGFHEELATYFQERFSDVGPAMKKCKDVEEQLKDISGSHSIQMTTSGGNHEATEE